MDSESGELRDIHAIDAYLRRLARRSARSESDADDLIQEVWLRALARTPSDPGRLRAWLRSVTENTWRNLLRGSRVRRYHEGQASGTVAPADDGAGIELEPSATLENHAQLEFVAAHVAALKEPYRGVIHGHYLRGQSIRELASVLGRPEGTIRVQLKRGLELLRARVGPTDERSRGLVPPGLLGWFRGARRAHPGLLAGLVLVPGLLLWTLVAGLGPREVRAEEAPRVAVEVAGSDPALPAAAEVLETGEGRVLGEVVDSGAPPAAGLALRGTVRDSAGRPLADARVLAGSAELGSRQVAVSGPDGSYEVFGLRPSDWIRAVSDDQPSSPTYAVLEAGPVLDLISTVSRGRLSGVLLDSERLPVEGVRVALTQKSWIDGGKAGGQASRDPGVIRGSQGTFERQDGLQEDVTDAAGRFSLWIPDADRATLVVMAGERGYLCETLDLGEDPGAHSHPLEVLLGPPTVLEVRLLDEGGSPCVGALVCFDGARPFRELTVRSDASGLARLAGVAPGPFAVRVVERQDASLASGYLEGTLEAGEKRRVDLELSTASTLFGSLARDGRPLPGHHMSVTEYRPVALSMDMATRTVRTGPDGSFAFLGVPPDLKLNVIAQETPDGLPVCESIVRAKSSPLRLESSISHLRGRIVLSEGAQRPSGVILLPASRVGETMLALSPDLEFEATLVRGEHAVGLTFPGGLGALSIPVLLEQEETSMTLEVPAPAPLEVRVERDPEVAFEDLAVGYRAQSLFDQKQFMIPLVPDPEGQSFLGTVFPGRLVVMLEGAGCTESRLVVEVPPEGISVTLQAKPAFSALLELQLPRPRFPREKFSLTVEEAGGPRTVPAALQSASDTRCLGEITLSPGSLRLEVRSTRGLAGEHVFSVEDLIPGRKLTIELREVESPF